MHGGQELKAVIKNITMDETKETLEK